MHLAGEAARGVLALLRRALLCGWRAAREPALALRRAVDGAAGLREVGWALTKPAPNVPLNVEIGPRRCSCWASAELADFKQIKDAVGGTVNDVSLAVAVRSAAPLAARPRCLGTDGLELRALVPVSIRTEDEHGQLGNRLTAMRAPLPVHVADPVQRLRLLSGAMDKPKASKQPLGARSGASTTGSGTSHRRCCWRRRPRSTSRPATSTSW